MKRFPVRRVYKKSSPNNKLTLYLASRDLIVSESKIDKLQGVLLVDPEYLQDKKVKRRKMSEYKDLSEELSVSLKVLGIFTKNKDAIDKETIRFDIFHI